MLLVGCAPADDAVEAIPTDPCVAHGEGIYAIDLETREILALAGHRNETGGASPIKFDVLPRDDGTFEFVYAPDLEGNLYRFTADMREPTPRSTPPELVLERAEGSRLNGPRYCDRGVVAFGDVGPTSVTLATMDAETFRERSTSTVAQARADGVLTPIQSEDFQIAADVSCRNIPEGLVYNGVDCTGTTSIDDCIADTDAVGAIRLKVSDDAAATALSAPQSDPDVIASPDRPPDVPLGDADPDLVVAGDGTRHLMFERVYATAAVFDDPTLPSEFSRFGFFKLMYKRLEPDASAPEYELDFRQWLGRTPEHVALVTPQMRIPQAATDSIEFTALGIFKTPNADRTFDEDLYTGLLTGRFDGDLSQVQDGRIVLDAADVDGVLSYAQFTCHVWDTCGYVADGDVYLYALFAPRFLRSDTRDALAFSTTRERLGSVEDGVLTFGNGTTMDAEAFRASICGP